MLRFFTLLMHKHRWRRIAFFFAPPSGELFRRSLDGPTRERATYGITTIVWECDICGKSKKMEVLGEVVDRPPVEQRTEKYSRRLSIQR